MFGQSFVFGSIAGGAAVTSYLVVGGGGAGTGAYNDYGGGGGGGGDAKVSAEGFTFTEGVTYTITIGGGGSGNGSNGTNSSLIGTGLSVTANAGTAAQNGAPSSPRWRYGGDSPNYSGGNGGTPPDPNFQSYRRKVGGGGGAGASAAGGNGSYGSTGGGVGSGGDGIYSFITGTEIGYAGGAYGGGGAGYSKHTSNFGAGASSSNYCAYDPGGACGYNAPANRGGGGGGQYYGSTTVYSGGSGVVILSIPTSQYSGTTTGSPTETIFEGNTILTFTGSGSYTH